MPTLSTPILTASNIDDTTVRLSVAYTVTFTPGEVLARQVFEESVDLYASPDEWAIMSNFWGMMSGGSSAELGFWSTNVADAVAAVAATATRTHTVDIARATLDVAMPGGEMLSALVRLTPYVPPKEVVAGSNRVDRDWGSR